MITTLTSSLVLLRNEGSMLLGMKKRGFGMGKWNGFGGKVQEGETILDCAKRELLEECGIVGKDLEYVGYLLFQFDDLVMHVHVYTSSTFVGEPCETEEMRPCWFPENKLPLNEMWMDNQYWLPLLLKGAKFRGTFTFKDTNTLENYDLQEIFLAEMCPRWFPENELPLNQMWIDDQYWMPLLLKGAKFRGKFTFKDTETLLNYELQEVTSL